uniref:Uncharacterized protein n=1 Tax=Rhizophora mucronata TaxID=61149 RepID=A0A2P2Q0I8_RHIMU
MFLPSIFCIVFHVSRPIVLICSMKNILGKKKKELGTKNTLQVLYLEQSVY